MRQRHMESRDIMSIYICWLGVQRTAEQNSMLISRRCVLFRGPGTCLPRSGGNRFYRSGSTRLSGRLHHAITKTMAFVLENGSTPRSSRHPPAEGLGVRTRGHPRGCSTPYPLIWPGRSRRWSCWPENSVAACWRADAAGDTVHPSTGGCQGWNADLAKLLLQGGSEMTKGSFLAIIPT